MPRKTKEQKELEKEATASKTAKVAKADKAKKSTTSKTSKTTKTEKAKKTTKTSKAKATKTTKTTKSAKTAKTTKAKTTKTAKATKATKTKKATTSKKKVEKKEEKEKKVEILEYYDLPYRYNQTVVKLLAQTPNRLFVYWDISDEDRKNLEEQYGENFFSITKPILIVYNDTLGYSFEVEINDFANSWYLNVADSKCDYHIELGRRPIEKTQEIQTDYIYVTSSNEIESPNDRILFDQAQKTVYFRNIKTGFQTKKDITTISSIQRIGKIYNIYDLYKEIYKNENIEELYDLSNPSSNPSSNSFLQKENK